MCHLANNFLFVSSSNKIVTYNSYFAYNSASQYANVAVDCFCIHKLSGSLNKE